MYHLHAVFRLAPVSLPQGLSVAPDSEYKIWEVDEFLSARLDAPEKRYYLYIKASRTNLNEKGVFLLSENAIAMDDVTGYYHLLCGVLNSEFDGERSFVTMYGFTEVLPGRITTDKIVSSDGINFLDLVNNALHIGNNTSYIDWNNIMKNVLSLKNCSIKTVNSDGKVMFEFSGTDGSGQLAKGNISWDADGNSSFNGKINASSGKIGGFDIGSNRIGSVANAQGGGGYLAIYDDFLRVGGNYGYAMLGNDVIPSTAGGAFTATGRIVNEHLNTQGDWGFDQANYGLLINVSGGTKNYGIESNAAMKAPAFINTRAKLLNFSGGSYSVDFSQHNVILMYYYDSRYSGVEVELPTENSVARHFGLSLLPTDFATIVTFRVRTGSMPITLLGIYNHNEDLTNYKMGDGDSVIVLITKADGFRYQILNHSS